VYSTIRKDENLVQTFNKNAFKDVMVDEWITLTWMFKNWVRNVQI